MRPEKRSPRPSPSRFKCWLSDLQLNHARWECDETGRRWDWIPFVDPIRFRVEYKPRVSRWIDGAAPFLIGNEIQACEGKDVISEERFEESGRAQYLIDDFRHGKLMDPSTLGLRCLPPFASIGHYRAIAEIDGQALAPRTHQDYSTQHYTLHFPRSLLDVEVTWDTSRNWFTKIESTRLGVPSVLLDKIRRQETLSEEEKSKLRHEREIVETASYLADEFEESPKAGIYFPGKMDFTREWRNKSRETWSWRITNWTANVPIPNELFRLEIPPNCRLQDRRKPSS